MRGHRILVQLPHADFSERLMNAGLGLKDAVVKETWGKSRWRLLKDDYMLYTRALGTAFLVFKACLVTRGEDDLKLCSEIVESFDAASRDSGICDVPCFWVFTSEELKQAAVEAAEVVWRRGLLKRIGICHGISSNAKVFLMLYSAMGEAKYVYWAKAFASFLHERALELISPGKMNGGDRPSLCSKA